MHSSHPITYEKKNTKKRLKLFNDQNGLNGYFLPYLCKAIQEEEK